MLTLEHADWYYRCGQTQARADALGQELRDAIKAFDRAVRSESVNDQVESAAVATSEETRR